MTTTINIQQLIAERKSKLVVQAFDGNDV